MTYNNHAVTAPQFICELCKKANSARSLSIYLLWKYGSHIELVSYLKKGIDPKEYEDATSFSVDYALFKSLSKYKGFTTGVNLRDVAFCNWLDAEKLNLDSNKRIRNCHASQRVEGIIHGAIRKIDKILGPCPENLGWTDKCSWSGGSTYDLPYGTVIPQKMTSKLSVTPSAYWYAAHLVGHDNLWCSSLGLETVGPCCLLRSEFTFVRGGSFTTVPKDSTTDRTIEKQPTANIYLQKGLGKIIREKLRRAGVDLNSQLVNQELASHAGKLGLATLDLKDASNSITRECIAALLPHPWYCLLDDMRTKECEVDGTWYPLQMFSAMGNGFTFELESLIFYALAKSVCDSMGLVSHYTAVFGDDIVVPAEAVDLLIETLSFFGFRINHEKSYVEGSFYESCGKHFFSGVEVTPFYQKEILDRPEEIIRFHNRIHRWASRVGCPFSVAGVLYRVRQIYIFTDKKGQIHVPRIPEYGTDDSGFISRVTPGWHSDSSLGYLCYVYRPLSRFKQHDQRALSLIHI